MQLECLPHMLSSWNYIHSSKNRQLHVAALRDAIFETLLYTIWIRPPTWSHSVHKIAVLIFRSAGEAWSAQWVGFIGCWCVYPSTLLSWTSAYFRASTYPSILTVLWFCEVLHVTAPCEIFGWWLFVAMNLRKHFRHHAILQQSFAHIA